MLTSRKTYLPFALPSISEEAIEEVAQVLRSGWVTSGPKTKQFEIEFAHFIGTQEAVAVNSATAGLHLALEAIGVDENSAVITSCVTFTATTEVICYFKAEPILSDVDPITNNITVATLKDTIQSRCKWDGKILSCLKTGKTVRAIMPVHLAGYSCDMEGILELAKFYGLYVIEDAAHSFPAIHKGKMIGTWGDFTVFSFYATKGITTGEGGMVTSRHSHLLDRIKKMRLHGINRDAFNRPGWYYEVVDAGYKYNLTDIQAALGIVQLREANQFWKRRTEIAHRYLETFQGIPGMALPPEDLDGKHSWHLFRVKIDSEKAKVGRDTLVEELKDRNIGTSLHFIPIFEHPYYKKTFGYESKDFPVAKAMYDRSVSLPLFAGMTKEDEDDVINAVKEVLL